MAVSYFEAVTRGLRLRCPRCGQAPLFRGFIKMHTECAACGLKFERGPGYFLGSIYLNYGFTVISLLILYMLLHFGYGFSNRQLSIPLVAYCLIVPTVMFRFARALWLAMDCFYDTTDFAYDRDEALREWQLSQLPPGQHTQLNQTGESEGPAGESGSQNAT